MKKVSAVEYINKNDQLNDENNHSGVFLADRNMEGFVKKYGLIINLPTPNFEKEASNFMKVFPYKEAMIHKDDLGRGGGGMDVILNYINKSQPALLFSSLVLAEYIINKIFDTLYHKYKDKLLNFFNKSKKKGTPLYVKYLGKNRSDLEFRFFSYFSNKEFERAWKKIPDAIKKTKLEKNKCKILVFDSKRRSWIVEGESDYSVSERRFIN